jgi:hypothetical protein
MGYWVTSIKVIYKKSLKRIKNTIRKVLETTCIEVTPPHKIPDGENENERKNNRKMAGTGC